ncbi:MAG: methyltetrahydrofolate cobalamin methyltransferase, partial [Caldilineaceae bacterium SB0675_bin_29]|nr:methyltetrahydrofolate cobalamin methyltransferase [Caldilineaceae bacterium SB0675_bin_29]
MNTVISSAKQTVVIGPDHPFVIIGERINPTGRKVLTKQMIERDMTMVCRDARRQVEAKAHVLDVNAGVPVDGVEPAILRQAIQAVQQIVDVPISIDSSVVEALEEGLAVYQGKALVNSVTYEEERLETVLPLVKKFGAAVVGVANDDTGISNDPQERLQIATQIVERAADHGIPPEDVIIDPLALTVSADDNAALVTLETIRLIRENLGVNMTCGASNISFGLPWRPTVNAAFLSMAIAAGLTSAITNPLEAEIRHTIYAADLLMGHDAYAGNLIQAFRSERKRQQ